jgi:hypothetical protein
LGIFWKGSVDAFLLDSGFILFQLGHGSLWTESDLFASSTRHWVATVQNACGKSRPVVSEAHTVTAS